jgi:hypothetical protein
MKLQHRDRYLEDKLFLFEVFYHYLGEITLSFV